MPGAYATIASQEFEHKYLEFYSKENDFGKFVTIKESYKEGVRMDKKELVLITEEYVQSVINMLESHVAFAANYDKS